MVISPYAKANFVDGTLTDQSSILRFIEDNWSTGRVGSGSFDMLAGALTNMFDFSNTAFGARKLLLDPTPVSHCKPTTTRRKRLRNRAGRFGDRPEIPAEGTS